MIKNTIIIFEDEDDEDEENELTIKNTIIF